MKIVVIYKSKTGFAKKYAEWITGSRDVLILLCIREPILIVKAFLVKLMICKYFFSCKIKYEALTFGFY
jgi:hypothetical protein